MKVQNVSQCLTLPCSARVLKASQLGVYRAFVDNYKVAVETADKCCQANAQFAQISEVCHRGTRQHLMVHSCRGVDR